MQANLEFRVPLHGLQVPPEPGLAPAEGLVLALLLLYQLLLVANLNA